MTPPTHSTKKSDDKTLLPYVHKPLVLKKVHKLRSFAHLLQAVDYKTCAGSGSIPRKHAPNGNVPSTDSSSEYTTFEKESQTDGNGSEERGGPFHGHDSTYIIFIKGMNNVFTADKEEVVNAVLNLVNKHVISISSREHKLFGKEKKVPSKTTAKHIILKGALLAINELVDEGVLNITPHGLVHIAQGVAFTMYFHKTLIQFGKDIWNGKHAEFIRDAWLSFGGLAAVIVMSATRQ